VQLPTFVLSLAFILTLTLCPAQAAKGSKKNNAEKPPAVSLTGSGDIDQRIYAAETELTRLTVSLESLRQDSAKAAVEAVSSKAAALAKTAPVENLYTQKVQELAVIKTQRDKARQDSIALAIKRINVVAAQKQESGRMDAALLSASNQLNVLSSRRQQIPVETTGGENKTVSAIERDITRADSAVTAKQMDIAAFGKKRDQLHQDSLFEESKASDARVRVHNEGGRLDSLLLLSSGSQNDVAGQQAKSKELTGNAAQEQAKLEEYQHTKAVLDAQIVRIKGEMAAINAERDRLIAAAGASQKKLDQNRSPFFDALAATEAKLRETADKQDGCASLSEKVRLDSAIQKAKDALNTAIEHQAVGKKGAEKAVSEREGEVAELMGRLDDVVRKNPKMEQVSGLLSGLSTTAEKRKRLDSLAASFAAQIATLSLQRDRAKRSLEEFDRTHPVATSVRSLTLNDSLLAVKGNSAAAMAARRDSLENQIVASERTVEVLRSTARAETAKSDSIASFARNQRSDLLVKRSQVRADSIKNESGHMVALMRQRAEQSKIAAQIAALDRDVANLGAVKERLKLSVIDAQNREKQTRAANQSERKRLDSLIGVKEREVAQLSMQNEKGSLESQGALTDMDALIQKQAALIASAVSQIAPAEQDVSSLSQNVDSGRRQRSAADKAGLDKIRAIELDKAAVCASIASKRNELAALKSQRETLRRSLIAELAHLDSMVVAAGKVIATYEGMQVKAKQDSAAAEGLKTEAQTKSASTLRDHDGAIAAKQQQIADASVALEKARQDSVAKSAPQSGEADRALKSADSIVALKERELAVAREQREKARLNVIAEQRRQFAVVVAAHQEVVNRRSQVDQKRGESALLQAQRKKLQQDSAATVARYQAAARLAGNEAARQIGLMQQKNYELSALQAQRSDYAAKFAAMGAAVSPAKAITPASSKASPADAGQAQLEEIYMLIGAEKSDEAAARFNAQRAFLAKSLSADAFAALKYNIEQFEQTPKKSKDKKK